MQGVSGIPPAVMTQRMKGDNMKTILRYLVERIVQSCVLVLNVIVFVLYAVGVDVVSMHTLAGVIVVDVLFIFRGIMWEGHLTDELNDCKGKPGHNI